MSIALSYSSMVNEPCHGTFTKSCVDLLDLAQPAGSQKTKKLQSRHVLVLGSINPYIPNQLCYIIYLCIQTAEDVACASCNFFDSFGKKNRTTAVQYHIIDQIFGEGDQIRFKHIPESQVAPVVQRPGIPMRENVIEICTVESTRYS